MTTEDIKEIPGTTPNFQTDLARQLEELVPEAISDGRVDVVKLQELLGADVADSSERFGLFWPGKKRALRAAQEPTSATLRPDRKNSKDWDTTKNVFIEGDNLEVLKILQKHYHGKIKMIYIDPPYNTGKDFIYPDNYKEGLDTYLEWTKQVNKEGKKVSTNSESEGRYHSNWLNMMYPRLKLARNLLTLDGVVFISIDDNEQDNLKKVCNEVFGESNFVAELPTIMNLKGNNDQFGFAGTHEYTLVYARSVNHLVLDQFPVDDEGLERWDTDERGPFKRGASLKATGTNAPRAKRPNLFFPIYVSPALEVSLTEQAGWTELLPITDGAEMSWRWSREKFLNDLYDVIVVPSGSSFTLYKKQRPTLGDIPTSKPKSTFYKPEYSSGSGTAAIKQLFDGKKVFDNPKPLGLLQDFIQLGAGRDGIVLDLFAGSAAIAHAVMALNRSDGGQRRTISIQLPEPVTEGSDAEALGYKTICEVARARIVKAGDSFAEQLEFLGVPGGVQDLGFRAFVLSDTSFSKWRVASDTDVDSLTEHLLSLRDSAADDVTHDALLTELLLKQGYSLTEDWSELEVDGLVLRSVGDGLLLAYLDERTKPTHDQLRSIVDEEPARFVILEDAFQGDDELKTNLSQLCKSKGVELWTA
ncbi:site-specific DNA-methyltransferase [Ornithinimicrobium kibberense]|uniref:Site-specific DNA-methyltransferase n=1 Tax=Ornithinimicrobium kibberense TaxID=282060 RepID=A0ABV5V3I1_9MICO|nr:site-specific DNA-methyltransferase [Ornithinimicrobium kibberense]